MQGSVSANHLNNFSDRFSEGSVYRMSGFDNRVGGTGMDMRSTAKAAGNQPFNNNKTVAGKHAEEHTSMRHHNSAAQGGVSNDCTRYVLLVLT
ncbi:unnamed protein product [Brassica rapa subsp. trilocularis]|uniref:Uncharacterized protein n=1 Tax=Brassica campestris TaxID=3711 RepID=M4DJ76_BRACM